MVMHKSNKCKKWSNVYYYFPAYPNLIRLMLWRVQYAMRMVDRVWDI
jgi:hypothetical protein